MKIPRAANPRWHKLGVLFSSSAR